MTISKEGFQMKRKLCLAAVLVLALSALAGGVAWAAAKKTAKAKIQGGNNNCGVNHPKDPTLGTVSYKRSGETVSIKVSLKKGVPNATYGVDLYGNGCLGLRPGPLLKTNKKGVGHESSSYTVPLSDTEFFAAVFEESPEVGIANDTPYVTLAP
ncbi:MAG: hypothetical protein ACYDC2_04435 [Solirubrobacteraceae bacterium]